MSKNIEKIKGEEALSEIVDITLDDAKLNGLVSNDVADMYQSASGLRPLKPTDTYESPIAELKANLKLIFRRLFSVPLTILGSNKGSSPISIIKMMEQMFNHYRERLKGSEEYGIPSRLSSLTDLPSAPALLADRKINGVDVPDGISIANLIGSGYTDIEEVNDTNHGWSWVNCHDGVMNQSRGVEKFFTKFFPNLKKITLNCKSIVGKGGEVYLLSSTSLEEIYFKELETYTNTWYSTFFNGCTNLLVLEMPNFASFYEKRGIGGYIGVGCNKLRRAVFGNMYGINKSSTIVMKSESPDLIHLEFGHNGIAVAESMNLSVWSPTNALDTSRTDLIEEGSTAANNLEQFLQNFRDYIALRLTDNGTGLTLTLSQEVRNVIHAAEDEYGIENIIITQKGWTISPAPN